VHLLNMISEGKAAGWLQLPTEAFLPWAKLNDIAFDHALPGVSMGKGGALLASNEVNSNGGTPQALMTVPRSLILSLERVMEHAKVDKDFREVLESLGEFGRVCGTPTVFWSLAVRAESLQAQASSAIWGLSVRMLMEALDGARCHPYLLTCASLRVLSALVRTCRCSQPFYGVRLISLASLLLFIDLALVARGHQFIASSEDTAYMY